MKLSIIVPVYNVEQYISKCLTSLVRQSEVSYEDYEVIIVDDGSPDHSMEIVNSFEWCGCNHTIITQKNKGLSGARNTGFDQSKGDYVWFVDSDDYVSNNAVKKIFELCCGNDIINIAYSIIRDGKSKEIIRPHVAKTGGELLRKGISMQAQFHVFRRDFLVTYNLRFVEGIYHEDMEFTPRCVYLAESVASITDSLYYYLIREGSIMTTPNPKRAFDYLTVAASLIDFSRKNGETLKSTPLSSIICMSINNALNIIKTAEKEKQDEWRELFYNNNFFVEALSVSNILKYKVEGLILSYLHVDVIALYNFLQRFND